ncbi:hypothetical protein K7432_009999 [Basidiobolus ranarum]|uniref:Chitinase domain-containing protein 1 n=1 Tax=Basidiobolus ranarum TaxID=34480 RepID=A0ABR2WPE5_9FUNG
MSRVKKLLKLFRDRTSSERGDTTIKTNEVSTKLHAWIYYGAPGQHAPDTYKNNEINVLRVQYFNLLDTGILQRVDEDPSDLFNTQNGFSEKNVQELKKYSSEQLVTVAGHTCGIRALAETNKSSEIITTLTNFVAEYQLTGIDIDFESYGEWGDEDYDIYKKFIYMLGTRLKQINKKLAICGPAWTSKQSPMRWRYEDFVSLPVDYVTPMVYDYQCHYGGGQPICPLAWLKRWTIDMNKIFHNDRLVIGLPSYGYLSTVDRYEPKNLTLEEIKEQNGYHGGQRDHSSGEIIKTVGDMVYVSNDRESMNIKRKLVEDLGVRQVAVWHLGGNDWF